MDCPRCGTRLTRISLNGDLQSVYCEQCGFADVESDHTRVSTTGETWDDALRRFRTTNAADESTRTVDAETGVTDPDADCDTGGSNGAQPDDRGAPPDDVDTTSGARAPESDYSEEDGETERV